MMLNLTTISLPYLRMDGWMAIQRSFDLFVDKKIFSL
jgi:hypothetical protein